MVSLSRLGTMKSHVGAAKKRPAWRRVPIREMLWSGVGRKRGGWVELSWSPAQKRADIDRRSARRTAFSIGGACQGGLVPSGAWLVETRHDRTGDRGRRWVGLFERNPRLCGPAPSSCVRASSSRPAVAGRRRVESARRFESSGMMVSPIGFLYFFLLGCSRVGV